jgi:hypothetical protein
VTSRHFDVVVIGRSLSALTAAALLARREFRVLLLGQGEKPPTYRFDRHRLRRRSFTLLFGQSPVWRKVLHDLAQSQSFRRRMLPLDPMFTFLSEHRRLEVPPEVELFGREIDREFPEVRQLVDELYTRMAAINGAIDSAFERDVTWPPGTFFERLETARVAASLAGGETADNLLNKFPPDHPYRRLTVLPAMFASDLDRGEDMSPLALARLHGFWTRGLYALAGGEDDLESFFIERITAHGGECRLGSRAVVSARSGEAIAELTGGSGITSSAQRSWPRLTVTSSRFITNIIVKTKGLPDLLAEESFLLAPEGKRSDPRFPVVHLQKLASPQETENAEPETLLVAEIILKTSGKLTLLEAREATLATIRSHFPFLDSHLVAIDSPHDGLPAYDYSNGSRREVDRIHLQEGSSFAEPMEPLWSVEPSGFLDLAAEPVRGPVRGTFLIGKTVLPGLGQEGQLLAAWSVARLLTKKDSTRQRRRRQMWTKIETG